MAKKTELTPEELEQQADALLAAAEAEEKAEAKNLLVAKVAVEKIRKKKK